MIKITDIKKSFENTQVLGGISFIFPDAATTAVAGPSGNGKTTLINILLGVMKPDSGTIEVTASNRMA